MYQTHESKIVVFENNEVYVVMTVDEYESLLNGQSKYDFESQKGLSGFHDLAAETEAAEKIKQPSSFAKASTDAKALADRSADKEEPLAEAWIEQELSEVMLRIKVD